jgi:hypothetical protein
MNPGKILQTKFVKLGNMKGKTKAEIVRSVGSPTVITNNSDGSKTIEWGTGWYKIVLLFSADDKMIKIISQKLKP